MPKGKGHIYGPASYGPDAYPVKGDKGGPGVYDGASVPGTPGRTKAADQLREKTFDQVGPSGKAPKDYLG